MPGNDGQEWIIEGVFAFLLVAVVADLLIFHRDPEEFSRLASLRLDRFNDCDRLFDACVQGAPSQVMCEIREPTEKTLKGLPEIWRRHLKVARFSLERPGHAG